MKKLSPYAGVSFLSHKPTPKKHKKSRNYTQKLDLRFHQADFGTPVGFSPKILVQFDALNDHEIIIPLRRLQCKTQSRDLKTGKILIFDSSTEILDGNICLTIIETESEIRHVGGAKLRIENGFHSDTVEFTSQSDPTLVLGYIDITARITTKNSNKSSSNLSNEPQSQKLQIETRNEFLDSVGAHPCPPPMIYRFDSPFDKSSDKIHYANKKSEQNKNQDHKKFENFLIERLLQSASEELSLVNMTHHSGTSSVNLPSEHLVASDDYCSNYSVQPIKTVRSSTRNSFSSDKVKKQVPSGTYDRFGRPTLKPVYSHLNSSLENSIPDFRVLTRTYSNKKRIISESISKNKMVTTSTQTKSDSATQTTRPQTARSKVSNVRFSSLEMPDKMSEKLRTKSTASIGAQTENEFSLQQQTVLSCDISKQSKSRHLIGRNTLTDSQVSNHSHVTSLRISMPSINTDTNIQTDTENKTESDYSSEFSQTDTPRSFSDVTETVSFSPIENIQNLDNLTSVLLPVRSKSPTFIH